MPGDNPTTAMGTSPVTYSDEDGALQSSTAALPPSGLSPEAGSQAKPAAANAGPRTMGVGCDEYGVCYADAHGRPWRCPRKTPEDRAWQWLDSQFGQPFSGGTASDRAYSADEMVDAFMAGLSES